MTASNISKSKPSFTAMVQSGIRYAGTFEESSISTNDHLGHLFLDRPYRWLKYPVLHPILINRLERQWPGGYGFSMCRSKIGDTEFMSFEGSQIVNLGAGFCTRAERYAKQSERCTVFELDLAPAQEKKKRIMSKKCQTGYSRTEYLSIDFEKETIADVLLSSGKFDPKAKTLFFWEGVSMYLDPAAVDEVLAFVHTNSADGSLIVFDYAYLDYIRSKGTCGKYYGGNKVFKACQKSSEPIQFGIGNGNIEKWLETRGFSLSKHWTGEELEEEFMKTDDGRIVHRAAGPSAICVARVEKKTTI